MNGAFKSSQLQAKHIAVKEPVFLLPRQWHLAMEKSIFKSGSIPTPCLGWYYWCSSSLHARQLLSKASSGTAWRRFFWCYGNSLHSSKWSAHAHQDWVCEGTELTSASANQSTLSSQQVKNSDCSGGFLLCLQPASQDSSDVGKTLLRCAEGISLLHINTDTREQGAH